MLIRTCKTALLGWPWVSQIRNKVEEKLITVLFCIKNFLFIKNETSRSLSIIYSLITIPTCPFSRSCLIMNKELIFMGPRVVCTHWNSFWQLPAHYSGLCSAKGRGSSVREPALKHNDFSNWGHSRHPGRLEELPFNNQRFWSEVPWAWVGIIAFHLPKGQWLHRVQSCVWGGTLTNSFSFWKTI